VSETDASVCVEGNRVLSGAFAVSSVPSHITTTAVSLRILTPTQSPSIFVAVAQLRDDAVFKNLMSGKMIAVDQVMPLMGDYVPQVRGYMACTPVNAPGYAKGAVTFLYINQDPTSNISLSMYQGARLSGSSSHVHDSPWGPEPPAFAQLPRVEFVLSAPELLSRSVWLNGKKLELAKGGSALPSLDGVAGAGYEFVAPPQSYGFVVYTAAAAPACL
jgi:hypothetical protein